MFRKRAAVLLLAVFSAFILGPAATEVAQAKGLKLVIRDWQFHSSVGSVAEGGPGYSAGDSFFVSRGTGLKNSDEQIDTLKAIAWQDWTLPGPLYNTTVAADTVGALIVSVYPSGTSPTVAADTIDVTTQVSDDGGATWVTCANTGPKISPDVATMNAVAALETGTSNSFHHVVRVQTGGAINGGPFSILGTGPTANQTYGFQLFRLLLRGDHTGKYRVRITGWVNGDD